eukprot:GABV01002300.1.p1 GENE.GABV01002300.1~~GABV01002300.1.p1  ORF type:complete len:133 (+),score=14.89 GABV01002300.1:207-605(+)
MISCGRGAASRVGHFGPLRVQKLLLQFWSTWQSTVIYCCAVSSCIDIGHLIDSRMIPPAGRRRALTPIRFSSMRYLAASFLRTHCLLVETNVALFVSIRLDFRPCRAACLPETNTPPSVIFQTFFNLKSFEY